MRSIEINIEVNGGPTRLPVNIGITACFISHHQVRGAQPAIHNQILH